MSDKKKHYEENSAELLEDISTDAMLNIMFGGISETNQILQEHNIDVDIFEVGGFEKEK